MDLVWADTHIPAIIQGWYPGAVGGSAIANVLFGKVAPQAKLPITFYRDIEELPKFVDYSMKNRTYRYMKYPALYPFGYGLTYTEFQYHDPVISTTDLTADGIHIEVCVSNTGSTFGTETVQTYIRCLPG